MVLPTAPVRIIKRMEGWISDFIWNGAKPKIPLKVLQLHKRVGGMNLVDISARDTALKCTWVKTLNDDVKCRSIAFHLFSKEIKEVVFKCNFTVAEVDQIMSYDTSPFWYSVLQAWAIFHQCLVNNEDPTVQTVWFNTNIKVNNRIVFNSEAFRKGLTWVHQLYPNGNLMSVREAHQSYGLDFMEFYSIVTSLPKQWREKLRNPNLNKLNLTVYEVCLAKKNLAQFVYRKLTTQQMDYGKKIQKWTEDIASIYVP